MHRETWIFGYGSLIWRPAFRFEQRAPGYIIGWARRFWQGSTDHRGVPGAPGRVVTLIPEPGARCWGMAYRVAAADLDEVLRALDHREQGGYVRHDVPLYLAEPAPATTRPAEPAPATTRPAEPAPATTRPAEPAPTTTRTATMYVATPDNPHYLGAAPLTDIAAQVLASRGPSGSNVEYVLRLAEALAAMGVEDEHVTALAELVRRPAALAPSAHTAAASGRPMALVESFRRGEGPSAGARGDGPMFEHT